MMKGMGVSFNKILTFLVISTLAASGWLLFLQWQKEIINSQFLENALVDANASKSQAEIKYRKVYNQIQELATKLKDKDGQIENLTKLLESEAKEKNILAQKISDDDRSKSELEQQLASAKKELEDLKIKVSSLEQEKSSIQEEITGASKADNPSWGVQLPQIVVNPADKKEASLEDKNQGQGSILVVNKEHDFVVVNLGQSTGINIGDNFLVYRQGQLIGSVTVEEVRPDMSIASFDSGKLTDAINIGDQVRRQ